MSQIVKKKKGRPSKADLAARAAAAASQSNTGHNSHRRREEERREARRSQRRRGSVRYNLTDYDEDYLDDDEEFEFDDDNMVAEEEDDDGGRRREKKLKFVLKLPDGASRGRSVRSNGGGGDSFVRDRGSDSEEEDEEDRVVKKKKISGDGVDGDCSDNDDEEESGGKGESYKVDVVHGVSTGTLNGPPSRTALPEKKQLELILDKLQKKDTHSVYAEPVDPEELPDYHDIIKHPMDFATVRKKLANGSYSCFEQFESDIYLICSNAMQYNAPDTIYHKQAYAIKELAQKKFQRVRLGIERTRIENEQTKEEPNSEQKTQLSPMIRKQMKKPLGRSTQDPVSSDFSSGATLATTDVHNTRNGVQANNYERHRNSEGLVEGISSHAEDNVEKLEDLPSGSGKGMTPKFWRKPLVVDENRRGTYEISSQPVDRSESIFATFEGEDKQFIPVGLYEEHSYAQSLARFAGNLGPAAWGIASKRVEHALPQGSEFGRGWVMEYEPIPNPVLFVAGQSQKEYPSARKPQCPAVADTVDNPKETRVRAGGEMGVGGPSLNGSRPTIRSGAAVQEQNPFVKKLQHAAIPLKDDKPSENPFPIDDWGHKRSISDGKPPQVPSFGGSRPATPTDTAIQQDNPFVRRLHNASVSAKTDESPESAVTTSGHLDSGFSSEGKSSILPASRGSRSSTPTGPVIQPQNPFSRNNLWPENTVIKRIDANAPVLANQKTNPFVQKQFPANAEMPPSWQVDTIARNKNILQHVPSIPPSPASNGVTSRSFPNGNKTADINQMASSPSSGVSNQVIGTKTSFRSRQEQGLGDPVQAMRFSAENAQKQQMNMNNWHGPLQVRPSNQPLRGDNMSEATTAAGAWMPASAADINRHATGNPSAHGNQIPTDSVYYKTQELYPQFLQPREYPLSDTRHFQPERSKVPFEELVSNPVQASHEAHFQNRPMGFPQLLMTDRSRIPLHSPQQGFSPRTEQKKNRDTLPPDLNVAFQSTADPQQPDLALQL